MTDKEQVKAIIKQYADKGKKMYRETVDSRGWLYNAGFWDGYECCAKGLLRELEDMQEECMYSKDNYTDKERKALCEGCEEECRFNKKEDSVNNGLDLGCGVIWRDKVPASEDLETAIDSYLATYFGGEKEKQDWPFLKKMAIHFANWQKSKDAKLIINAKDDGYRLGLATMKQQMMAKAVDGVVHHFEKCGVASVHYTDPTGVPMAYFTFPEGLSAGDKVKIIVIKEG